MGRLVLNNEGCLPAIAKRPLCCSAAKHSMGLRALLSNVKARERIPMLSGCHEFAFGPDFLPADMSRLNHCRDRILER